MCRLIVRNDSIFILKQRCEESGEKDEATVSLTVIELSQFILAEVLAQNSQTENIA